MKRNALFLSILILSMIGLAMLHVNIQQPVHADEQAINSSNWNTPLKLSPNNTHAKDATVAAAPNGKTVLVAYSVKVREDGDKDIFDLKYSYSNKNGNPLATDWTLNEDVYSSSAETSKLPHATFDQNGIAHIVWIEDLSLTYAKSTNLSSGFGVTKTLSTSPVEPGADNPFIVTYEDDINIIWVESNSDDPVPNIYHVQSADGGDIWGSATKVSNSSGQIDKPSATFDKDGNLHIVYQELVTLDFFDVFYTMLPAGGSSFTAPVAITDNIPDGDYSMAEPNISYHNGRLAVSVTQAKDVDTLPNLQEAEQFVYLITCTDSCETDGNNWEAQAISQPDTPPVVGYPALYIDITPYYLSSSILHLGSCTTIVFDGKVTFQTQNKEQIFGSSNCTSWGNGRQTIVIGDNARVIKPTAVTQNNWWMYMAYEQFNDEDDREIYFIRNIPGVYLPMIAKPK